LIEFLKSDGFRLIAFFVSFEFTPINMEIHFDHDVQLLNHTDEAEFKQTLTDLLNKGYSPVSTSTSFDHIGCQYFHAVLVIKKPKEKKAIGFNFGG
jgi:hypothetical protein